MSLLRAVVYRVFASGNNPRRRLYIRAILCMVVALLLGWLSYRFAPVGYVLAIGSFSTGRIMALLYVVTYVFVTVLFVLVDGYHKTCMQRLEVVRYLPLHGARLRALHGITYIPFCLLALAITVPGLQAAFAGVVSPVLFWSTFAVAFVFAFGYNVVIRIVIGRWAQLLSMIGLLAAAALGWGLFARSASGWLVAITVNFIVSQLMISLRLLLEPVSQPRAVLNCIVREHTRITLGTALFLRALRTRRYRAANVAVLVAFGILLLLAWSKPQVLPFDAVAVGTLLLAGTLGQEARNLSHRTYPLELLRHALLARWLGAMWGLAVCNAMLFTLVVIASAEVWFPGKLSVDYGYVLCAGTCLVAASIGVSSLVAPQKGDVLGQLVTAGLYAILAWGIFKLFAGMEDSLLPAVTAAIVISSLATAYLTERMRWFLTVKGEYGLTAHNNT